MPRSSPCPELEQLRREAGKLRRNLRQKMLLAREKTAHLPAHERRPSDYEEFFERRVARLAEAIEAHLRDHGCQSF